MNSINSLKSSAVSFGEVVVHLPHQTPTIETPLTRVKFNGIFGILPSVKPITSNLPFHAVALNACSVTSPPTGSITTSTPFPSVSSFTVSFSSTWSYLIILSAPNDLTYSAFSSLPTAHMVLTPIIFAN